MKSGYDDYSGIWGNEYYDSEFKSIADRIFAQFTFTSGDALVSIRPVRSEDVPEHNQARFYQDGTVEVLYENQRYDDSKFKLVKGHWGHEHCLVCRCQIIAEQTFWQNSRGQILCDACHGHYLPQQQ